MEDLTLVVGSTDPAALYECYADLSRRYDQADEQINALSHALDRLDEDEDEEREHLLGELDRLDIGRSVLLGWVSAFFAAYMFALRGTDTPWIDRKARTATDFVDAADCAVRPLASARRGIRAVKR